MIVNLFEKEHPDAMFSHEKLQVYQKALACTARLETTAEDWAKKHDVRDQLVRALESVVVNIAGGCREHSPEAKQLHADYSLGSVLECAACIDVAFLKRLLAEESATQHKRTLHEIASMLAIS